MLIKEIKDILKKEIELCDYLLGLANKMGVAIKENNLEEINRLVRMEDALTMKFSVIEKKRDTLVKNFMNDNGYEGKDYCISEMEKFLNKNDIASFRDIRNKLTEAIKKLASVNQTNSLLIKSKLDWVNFSLQTINKMESKTYKASNNKQKINDNSIINELI